MLQIPKRSPARDRRNRREVVCRWRRAHGPFECPGVPWVFTSAAALPIGKDQVRNEHQNADRLNERADRDRSPGMVSISREGSRTGQPRCACPSPIHRGCAGPARLGAQLKFTWSIRIRCPWRHVWILLCTILKVRHQLAQWLRDPRVQGSTRRALAGHGCGNFGVTTGRCNGYPERVRSMEQRLMPPPRSRLQLTRRTIASS